MRRVEGNFEHLHVLRRINARQIENLRYREKWFRIYF